MKTALSVVLILSVVLAIHAAYLEGHDGRSACQTEEEVTQKYWRNNNDPSTYWVCSTLNEPSTAADCEPATGFLAAVGHCVDWGQWQWEEPTNPPSMV